MEDIQCAIKEELDFVWPSHSDFLIDSIYESFNRNNFTDVTLVCKDGTGSVSIKAHKMILAACSPALASLFIENIENHPLEFEGIQYENLKYMLDFMYTGQTIVPKHREEAFISIAKCFQVDLRSSRSEDQNNLEVEEDNVTELVDYASSKDLDNCENSTIVDFDENSSNLIQITVEDLYRIEEEEMKKKKHKSDTETDNSSNVVPISIEDLFKIEQEEIKKKTFNKTKIKTLKHFQGITLEMEERVIKKSKKKKLKKEKLFPCKKCGFHFTEQNIKDYADHVSLCKTPTKAKT